MEDLFAFKLSNVSTPEDTTVLLDWSSGGMVISDCRAALWNSSSGGLARGGILQGKIADYEIIDLNLST